RRRAVPLPDRTPDAPAPFLSGGLCFLECGDSFAALSFCLRARRTTRRRQARQSGEGIAALQNRQNRRKPTMPRPAARAPESTDHAAARPTVEADGPLLGVPAAAPSPAPLSPQDQMAQELHHLNGIAAPLEDDGAIGRTTFDAGSSDDLTLTVLLSQDNVHLLPSQSLVRVEGRREIGQEKRRHYLGVVVAGPFAEPDSLRHDSPVLLIAAT